VLKRYGVLSRTCARLREWMNLQSRQEYRKPHIWNAMSTVLCGNGDIAIHGGGIKQKAVLLGEL
jgi:hypothetical protein